MTSMTSISSSRISTNIKVRLDDGNWYNAYPYQIEGLEQFLCQDLELKQQEEDISYDKNGYKYKIVRQEDRGIYLIRENGSKMPICDWNNVKIFVINENSDLTDWKSVDENITEDYYNLIYNGLDEIDNTLHRIFRDDDKILCQTKNDSAIYRISDNKFERESYLGFYRRVTMI